MDTRSKIIADPAAAERLLGQPAKWVTGHFDPLLAEHVRYLQRSVAPGHLLVVEVTNPRQPLLPQRARAELVAALAMVDYVVMRNGDSPPQAAEDASVTERFVSHVLERHRQDETG